MESRSFALIIALIVTAGVAVGGGAWLALRQNDANRNAEAAVDAAGAGFAAEAPDGALGEAVHETEAVIDEASTAGPADPAPGNTSQARRTTERATAAPVAERVAPRPAPAPQRAPAPAPQASEPAGEPAWTDRATDDDTAWTERAPLEARDSVVTLPEPPPIARPIFEEFIVPADAVIGLQVDTAVTTEQARLEDRVEARVTRDVRVDSAVVIPAGTRVLGSVTLVEPGGKVRERARLGVRFHTIVLADGTNLPILTDTIYREGASPAGESTAKIGGAAAGGAIIGAILGGTKGAVLGGAAGAGAGTAATMAGDRNPATLPAGTALTVRLGEEVVVEVER